MINNINIETKDKSHLGLDIFLKGETTGNRFILTKDDILGW